MNEQFPQSWLIKLLTENLTVLSLSLSTTKSIDIYEPAFASYHD